MSASTVGKVYLVGAGPGDPELITLKGMRCLQLAEVILFDELINRELLELAPADSELIYVGKKAGAHCADQREIEALLIQRARKGQKVVRLKGGDPFLLGRGGEEAMALREAGIRFEIVPGVSSAIAAPAYAGIPVTHRACASSFAVVTGHKTGGELLNWGELARSVDTLVILMGLQNLRAIMTELIIGGCDPERPVALIECGTTADQKVLVATVDTIVGLELRAAFKSPTIIVLGEVVCLAQKLNWFDAVRSETRTACLEYHNVALGTI